MTPDSSSEPAQRIRLLSLPKTGPARKPFSATAEWPARVLRQRRPVAVRRHAVRLIKRLLILGIADVSAVLLIQSLVWALSRSASFPFMGGLPTPFGPAPAVVLLASLLVTGNYFRGVHLYQAARLAAASAVAAGVFLWPLVAIHGAAIALQLFVVVAAALWLILAAERRLTQWFLREIWPGPNGATPAIVVDRADAAQWNFDQMTTDFGGDYRPVGTLTLVREGKQREVLARLAHAITAVGAEAVIVASHLEEDQVHEVLDISLSAGCEFLYPARSVQIAGRRPLLVWHHDEPFFELGAPLLKAQALVIKRAVDVVGAILAMVLVAPVMVIVALIIRLDSPGPIFFWQDRAGLGGKRFRMLKFRTMHVGADDEKEELAYLNRSGDPRLFKIPNDPRVTHFGAWLRRWSIDELPQCWNVLIGDMSLVGPRPFFEADLESYEDHHFRRLDAKPGITGLWQVNGRSDVVDFEEVVRYDREYIEHWSLALDFKIVCQTIPALFSRTGAY
jgi:exopolysaccharide biosynthesis polyprenyl glycosylphosphotransferase